MERCKYDNFCDPEDKKERDCDNYKQCDLYNLQELFDGNLYTESKNQNFSLDDLTEYWRLNWKTK